MKAVDSGSQILAALRAQPERARVLLTFAATGVGFFALDCVAGTFFLAPVAALIVTTLLLALFAGGLIVLTAGLVAPDGVRKPEHERNRSLALARATNVRLMKGEQPSHEVD